ncbi:hypothetical protein Poly30_48120 [Planctomycetes bacterium Poly30]|uniref:Beta-propeller repeat protein n=1 Tax=Saltatorellus ferox TaxID=2528018 RepID=A0A518EYU0_9BACT|nr:hypothetical protein Poly30_48120 [Planctomycetes bacterium Poly30]
MRFHVIFSAALSLLAATPAASQSPDFVWTSTKTLSPAYDTGRDILPTADGGYFLQGFATIDNYPRTIILRYDADHQEQWRQSYGGPALTMWVSDFCSDGADGLLMAGVIDGAGYADPPLGGADGIVIRLDPQGNALWSRRIGGTGSDRAYGIVEDGSGGALVVGTTNTPSGFGGLPHGPLDMFVTRYDANGNQIWVARDGMLGRLESLEDVTPDGSGGYFCVGGSHTSAMMSWDPAGILARVDSNGVFQWVERALPDIELRGASADGAGGVVAVGTDYLDDRGLLVRADGNGTVQWTTPLVAIGSFVNAWEVERLYDGSFLTAGFARDTGPQAHQTAHLLVRFDLQGARVAQYVVDPSTTEFSALYGLALDGAGSGYITGYVPAGAGVHDTFMARFAIDPLGLTGCTGQPNSTGVGGRTQVLGTPSLADNTATVFATDLPPSTLGFFIASTTTGFVPNASGGQGTLCMGGAIGRFARAGEVLVSGTDGRMHLELDLGDFPTPTGNTAVVAGETWHFQAWHRDANPTSTTNFSGSVAVTWN